MNRRSFLKLVGAGLPSVVVAEKLGLIERVRSYFFAPKGGWIFNADPNVPAGQLTRGMLHEAFERCKYSTERLVYMNNAGIWEFGRDGIKLISQRLDRIPYECFRLLSSDSIGSLWRLEEWPSIERLRGQVHVQSVDPARKIVTLEAVRG